MESTVVMSNELEDHLAVNSIVKYESKKYTIDSKVSGSFSLKIRFLKRIIVRSVSGRETLLQQSIMDNKNAQVAYEIPPDFLKGKELCKSLVGHVLSKTGVDSLIQQCVVPNIAKDMIAIYEPPLWRRRRKGFIVEAEAEHVNETLWDNKWLPVEECNPKYREKPIEKEFIICLEELLLSSEQKKKTIMKLHCGHNFHRDCDLLLLRRKHSCPTCRGDINNPQAK